MTRQQAIEILKKANIIIHDCNLQETRPENGTSIYWFEENELITLAENELRAMETGAEVISADDLATYAINDNKTYFSIIVPTYKNMKRKIKNGSFDTEKAMIAFNRIAIYAAKRYHAEMGSNDFPWYKLFNPATRRACAVSMLTDFIHDYKNL